MMDAAVTGDVLLRTDALETSFAVRGGGGTIRAVDNVSLAIRSNEILGLVGESGCGKSTLGKTLMGMVKANAGRVVFEGQEITGLKPRALRGIRDRLQYVYQDAGASLDPRWTVGRSLEEPLVIQTDLPHAARIERVLQTVADVGLRAEHLDRYPHELSGGQQRRVGLARILTLHPRLVILDEPTSGLDVSVQATILRLLLRLREAYTLTYLFISHDLGVVRAVCDRVAVMYLGRIVEIGPAEAVFTRPSHPYTRSLLSAVPEAGYRRVVSRSLLEGDPPDPGHLPAGCRFRGRCHQAGGGCDVNEPWLSVISEGHQAACHYPNKESEDAG